MRTPFTRRDFLAASAAAGLSLAVARRLPATEAGRLKKALIGKPDDATFAGWKAAGFDGMETDAWDATPAQAEAGRKLAEKHGMRIHAVLRGWTNFNQPDKLAGDLASVETSLRAAQAYGADAVLLVPCRISGMAMPEAWEFQIEFDDKTGHLQQVVAGDNAQYQDYIAAHNQAIDASRTAVEKLIPVAEETRVIIALENVWNNLWVKPAVFAHFIRSFASPWVQCYYDIGNHVKYAPPEEWLEALGKLIVKLHIKDFLLNADGHGGKFVDIRDGSVNWPRVRKVLDQIGYQGWTTIEGSEKLPLEERSKRLDLIVSGK